MLRIKTLFIALSLVCLATVARADDPAQNLIRYLGFGWGDGYHSQRTWPLHSNAACSNCAPQARSQPTPAPAQKNAPQNAEPKSPSDRPALKTGQLRYPTSNNSAQRR